MRESSPPEATLASGRGRLSRVGADEELDLVVAVRREHRRILRFDARGEDAAGHAQGLHEASDLAVQHGRRLLPSLR